MLLDYLAVTIEFLSESAEQNRFAVKRFPSQGGSVSLCLWILRRVVQVVSSPSPLIKIKYLIILN